MAHIIKKRSGKRQVFKKDKLIKSIEKSAKDAKLSTKAMEELIENIAHPVAEWVRSKKEVHATNLRRSILGRLERRKKSVSNSWKKYDKSKKNNLF